MIRKFRRAVLAGVMLAASTLTHAGAISVDAGWYGFCFGGVGSPATPGCQNQGVDVSGNSFTFSLTGPALLKVTDAFQYGDMFDVFVNNLFAFATSGSQIGNQTSDPDIAFDGGLYSSGSLLLAAGNYEVDIFAKNSPYAGGGGYMEVQSAVPEPASLALLGLGLAGLGAMRRRKQ